MNIVKKQEDRSSKPEDYARTAEIWGLAIDR